MRNPVEPTLEIMGQSGGADAARDISIDSSVTKSKSREIHHFPVADLDLSLHSRSSQHPAQEQRIWRKLWCGRPELPSLESPLLLSSNTRHVIGAGKTNPSAKRGKERGMTS